MQSRLNAVQASVNTNLKALQESKGVLSTRMSQIESVAYDLKIKFNELMAIQLRDKAIIESLTSMLCQKRDSKCDKRRKSF
jgi:predicted nuclease with TOPRIM domain